MTTSLADPPSSGDQTASIHDERLTAVGLLFEAADGLRDMLSEALTPAGLAVAEVDVLLRLARSPQRQLRMSDLAAQVAMSASGLTRLIDRMQGRGLVTRVPCESDKRGSYATISDEGLARITSTLDAHLEVISQSFTGLFTDAEMASLLSALRRVREVVRPHATAGADHTGV